MNLKIFKNRKIIVCSGSGGVGKTTIAATIALEAAYQGKKSIVLTVDPAKRLATAMGLDNLGNTPKRIPLKGASGELFAMMLDTKRTFDKLIERHTQDQEKLKAILENRLYRHMSNMIAGSQEYMAMEKLYELHQKGDFDIIVLDTPPTRHALDFLEAPQRMLNLTGNSILHWFLKPGLFAGRMGFGVLQKGAEKILAVFDRLAGFAFLHELAEMLSLLGGLLGGFKERAQSVYDLLREDFVGFFLVASPSSVSIQDALFFHEKIQSYRLPFLGFIVNRVHESPEADPKDLLREFSSSLKSKIREYLRNYEQLALHDQKSIALLKKMGGRGVSYATIPLLSEDVHDFEGLQKMRETLF
jgi:anion-transporting  ArsA/GET3 family ATPase